MKTNKVVKILIFTIISILLLNIKSYGAVAIIKGAPVFVNQTISDFFDMCRQMKNRGQGLEGTNVDIHMSTNREWATVSYFSNSQYGTATQGQNAGISVTMDGKDYLSTNGNITGIMDWGKTSTFTAGIISNYNDITDTTIYNNGKSLIDNINSGVEIFDKNTTDMVSIGHNGWYNSWTSNRRDIGYPYSVRSGLFGFTIGWAANTAGTTGKAWIDTTFRPIIINRPIN